MTTKLQLINIIIIIIIISLLLGISFSNYAMIQACVVVYGLHDLISCPEILVITNQRLVY